MLLNECSDVQINLSKCCLLWDKASLTVSQFLSDEFINTRKAGMRRLDAFSVSSKMRKLENADGAPMFCADQRISATQMASYANRKLVHLEKEVRKVIEENREKNR